MGGAANFFQEKRKKILVVFQPPFIFALPIAKHAFKKGIEFELWCNGSTTDFGSVCLGSNPSSSTNKKKPLSSVAFFCLSISPQIWKKVENVFPATNCLAIYSKQLVASRETFFIYWRNTGSSPLYSNQSK